MEDDSTNSEMSDDDDVTGGACACPGFPTLQTTESGASTSAAPDQGLQTANSDSQSSLESLPSATTTTQSVASSEPLPGHTIKENVQVRKDCLIYSSILVAALWGNVTSSILPLDSIIR